MSSAAGSLWAKRHAQKQSTCSDPGCICLVSHKELLAFGKTSFDTCTSCLHLVLRHEPADSNAVFVPPVRFKTESWSRWAQNVEPVDKGLEKAIAASLDRKDEADRKAPNPPPPPPPSDPDLLKAIEISLSDALPVQSEGFLLCDNCKNYFRPETAAENGRPGCPNVKCREQVALHKSLSTSDAHKKKQTAK